MCLSWTVIAIAVLKRQQQWLQDHNYRLVQCLWVSYYKVFLIFLCLYSSFIALFHEAIQPAADTYPSRKHKPRQESAFDLNNLKLIWITVRLHTPVSTDVFCCILALELLQRFLNDSVQQQLQTEIWKAQYVGVCSPEPILGEKVF